MDDDDDNGDGATGNVGFTILHSERLMPRKMVPLDAALHKRKLIEARKCQGVLRWHSRLCDKNRESI